METQVAKFFFKRTFAHNIKNSIHQSTALYTINSNIKKQILNIANMRILY